MQERQRKRRKGRSSHRNIEKSLKTIFVNALEENTIFDDITLIEMYAQEESACALDLSFHPTVFYNWRKFAKVEAIRSFPQICREHFVAERIPHIEHMPQRMFAQYYKSIFLEGAERLETFELLRKLFLREIFLQFETLLFKNSFQPNTEFRKRAVRKFLSACRIFKIDRYMECFEFLIHLCTNPPLNSELTVGVLTALCDTDSKKTCSLLLIRNHTSLVNMLRHAAEKTFDYWGLWKGTGEISVYFTFLNYFISAGVQCSHSRVLLQYGFPYVADPEIYLRRCNTLIGIEIQNQSIVCPYGQQALSTNTDRFRMMLVMDIFTSFLTFDGSQPVSEKVKTLVYLTRALPDPLVTPDELYYCLRDVVQPYLVSELKRISQVYATCRDIDYHEELQPRRLQHLCRCTIRKELANNFMLMDGINELKIPEELKAYLVLES